MIRNEKNIIVGQCWDCEEPISELYSFTGKYLSTFRCHDCYSKKGFDGISTDLSRKDLEEMREYVNKQTK